MGTDITQFKRTLGAMIDKGDLTLPSTVSPDAFRNAAIVAFQTNPMIRRGTPESVFTALRHIAGAGLMPDGREAAIVVYGDKAQAQPMVAGLRKIARNSGKIAALWDDVVYEGETIIAKFEDGVRVMEHVKEDGSPIDMMRRGGEIVGAYAAAKLTDGTVEMEPMTIEEIEKRRKASPNQKTDKPTGIWKDWYSEMARKTAVRALCKRLPMSSEDYNRIAQDPTFQEVETKDVTPKETTAERLERLAREKREAEAPEPDDGAKGEGEVEDAEVIPDFDENLATPMDKEFDEGVQAFEAGQSEVDCPYADNPAFSKWVAGFREAKKFKEEVA